VLLDLDDETFAGMGTVTGAVTVLRTAIAEQLGIVEAGHG